MDNRKCEVHTLPKSFAAVHTLLISRLLAWKTWCYYKIPSTPSGGSSTVSTSLPTSTRSMCRSVGGESNLTLLPLAFPFTSFMVPNLKLDCVPCSRLVHSQTQKPSPSRLWPFNDHNWMCHINQVQAWPIWWAPHWASLLCCHIIWQAYLFPSYISLCVLREKTIRHDSPTNLSQKRHGRKLVSDLKALTAMPMQRIQDIQEARIGTCSIVTLSGHCSEAPHGTSER
jgi:hypothetical protein